MKKYPDEQNDNLTDLEKAIMIAGERAMKRLAEMAESSPENQSQPKDNLPPPPERCNFESEEEYEEAKGYYRTHIGASGS